MSLMDELFQRIQREYALTVNEYQPFRTVRKLFTAKGVFLLKQMHCTEDQLLRIDFWLQQLTAAGFPWAIPFLATRDGLPFIEFKRKFYIISPWQSGTAPVFTNIHHLKKVAELWGEMHRVSQTLLPADEPLPFNYWNDLQRKVDFLKSLLQSLQNRSCANRIDRSIRKWGEYFLNQARFSLARLEAGNFESWTRTAAAKGFCHNDPAPRNIVAHNRDWYIIDFDLSGSGLFIGELFTLLQRVLKANQWKAEIIAPLLETYCRQRPTSSEELEYLPALLCFPRAFLRLCSQRFHENLPWTEKHFQSRLWEITTEEPIRLQLLQSWFPKLNPKIPDPAGEDAVPSMLIGGCS
jgi:CotS family spore coat protein